MTWEKVRATNSSRAGVNRNLCGGARVCRSSAGALAAMVRRGNGDADDEEQQGRPPLLLGGNFVIQFLPRIRRIYRWKRHQSEEIESR